MLHVSKQPILKVLTCRLICAFVVCIQQNLHIPGRIAQSVMCLATDASPTADPGVAS